MTYQNKIKKKNSNPKNLRVTPNEFWRPEVNAKSRKREIFMQIINKLEKTERCSQMFCEQEEKLNELFTVNYSLCSAT